MEEVVSVHIYEKEKESGFFTQTQDSVHITCEWVMVYSQTLSLRDEQGSVDTNCG